jgi:long-chain fatty acid transport protein
LLLTLASLHPACATNGLNVIGFGTESEGMAGADVAVARDTTALNTNPAGLAQVSGSATDGYAGAAFAMDVRHQDQFDNDRKVSNWAVGLGGFGYARQYGNLDYGIGFFGQGGSGSVFREINTAFGTSDELSVLLRIAKLTPGLAYRVNDKLSLGFSASIAYASIKQRVFPETSFFNAADPARSFFGYGLDGADHVSFSPKFGILYHLSDRLTLGASYTVRSPLPLEGGAMVSNQSAIGLGKVTYRDVRLEGIALPQEIAVGAALQYDPKWLWSVKLDWLNWSAALNSTTLTATDPDNGAAAPVLSATNTQNWRDQWVIAVGGEYRYDDKTVLLFGYNYGRNPIPSQNLNPLLAAISEHHITFGAARQISTQWNLSMALEYAYSGKLTYTNPELPFGPNAAESDDYLGVYVMASRRW